MAHTPFSSWLTSICGAGVCCRRGVFVAGAGQRASALRSQQLPLAAPQTQHPRPPDPGRVLDARRVHLPPRAGHRAPHGALEPVRAMVGEVGVDVIESRPDMRCVVCRTSARRCAQRTRTALSQSFWTHFFHFSPACRSSACFFLHV